MFCTCYRMGIREERWRRSETRYNWDYSENDYGLNSSLRFLFYCTLYFIELYNCRKEIRISREKEWKR